VQRPAAVSSAWIRPQPTSIAEADFACLLCWDRARILPKGSGWCAYQGELSSPDRVAQIAALSCIPSSLGAPALPATNLLCLARVLGGCSAFVLCAAKCWLLSSGMQVDGTRSWIRATRLASQGQSFARRDCQLTEHAHVVFREFSGEFAHQSPPKETWGVKIHRRARKSSSPATEGSAAAFPPHLGSPTTVEAEGYSPPPLQHTTTAVVATAVLRCGNVHFSVTLRVPLCSAQEFLYVLYTTR